MKFRLELNECPQWSREAAASKFVAMKWRRFGSEDERNQMKLQTISN